MLRVVGCRDREYPSLFGHPWTSYGHEGENAILAIPQPRRAGAWLGLCSRRIICQKLALPRHGIARQPDGKRHRLGQGGRLGGEVGKLMDASPSEDTAALCVHVERSRDTATPQRIWQVDNRAAIIDQPALQPVDLDLQPGDALIEFGFQLRDLVFKALAGELALMPQRCAGCVLVDQLKNSDLIEHLVGDPLLEIPSPVVGGLLRLNPRDGRCRLALALLRCSFALRASRGTRWTRTSSSGSTLAALEFPFGGAAQRGESLGKNLVDLIAVRHRLHHVAPSTTATAPGAMAHVSLLTQRSAYMSL